MADRKGNDVAFARELLQEWNQYKDVKIKFDPTRMKFPDAIELQFKKDQIDGVASIIGYYIMNEQFDHVFDSYVSMFQKDLARFKDLITIEILRNGPNQK